MLHLDAKKINIVDHRVNNNLAENNRLEQPAVHSSELPNSDNFQSRLHHLLFHDQACKREVRSEG